MNGSRDARELRPGVERPDPGSQHLVAVAEAVEAVGDDGGVEPSQPLDQVRRVHGAVS